MIDRLLKILLFINFTCFLTEPIHSKEDDDAEKNKPPEIGNFSLPTSQQPAALFGFGGNIIDENEVQINLFSDEFSGYRKKTLDLIPGILFGIQDNLSLYLNFPFTPEYRDNQNRSSGLEDFFLQLEYAFYTKTTKTATDQATIVANISYPTGSINKTPFTGFGAPGFFIGGTYYHTTVEWVLFTSQGAILTTPNRGSKIGNFFLYQFGIARNIPSPKDWIYALMLELDGQYQNRFHGIIDKNSGSHAIYVTPSFWVSSKYLTTQFGFSLPIYRNFKGNQTPYDFALNFNISWSFY